MKQNIRTIARAILCAGLLLSAGACNSNSSEAGKTSLKSSDVSAAPAATSNPGTATPPTSGDRQCGSYEGHQLYRGPKGGCYYYNSNGKKEYIGRDKCNC